MRNTIILVVILSLCAVIQSWAQYQSLLGVGHPSGGTPPAFNGGNCLIVPGYMQPCGDDLPLIPGVF